MRGGGRGGDGVDAAERGAEQRDRGRARRRVAVQRGQRPVEHERGHHGAAVVVDVNDRGRDPGGGRGAVDRDPRAPRFDRPLRQCVGAE